MTLKLRSIFFIITGLLLLWFLYIERAILTPFILAAIFAYIFNPLINLFSKIFKFPRTLSIILVYVMLVFSVLYIGSLLTRELLRESENIRQIVLNYISYLKSNIDSLPSAIQPYVASYTEFPKIQIQALGLSAFPVFSLAFSGILNLLVFIFATFFFLKDNEKITDKFLLLFSQEERIEMSALIKKINTVLSKYLRGQIILIISLAVILFASFSFLGIKNALTISILSALAGIVPMIGTITAIIIGTFVILLSGGLQNFQLGILETILVVVGVYYGAQLIQDYILSPFILGKAVRLHPLIILFAALAGGNLAGIIGLILAVPIAATIKIIFEFALDKINHRDYLLRKSE
ncbi:MAG: AI-2E family transporter [Patescibacteria group bacterium]|nr:AI-2E family transporter [Patescibacteria group bacterium]